MANKLTDYSPANRKAAVKTARAAVAGEIAEALAEATASPAEVEADLDAETLGLIDRDLLEDAALEREARAEARFERPTAASEAAAIAAYRERHPEAAAEAEAATARLLAGLRSGRYDRRRGQS